MNKPTLNTTNANETVVVLVDPCHDHHPALDNFIAMASQATEETDVKLVIAVSPTSKESEEHNLITCSDAWLQSNIHEPLQNLDIPYSIIMTWSYYWDDAVLEINKQHTATLTIVPYYSNLPGNFLNDEKWKLLRKATNPVLISSDQDYSSKASTMLCTLKTQDKNYAERNQRVVETAENLAALFNLDTHAVNAYSDSMNFPDRAQIASHTGIENEKIHVKIGEPQEVICDVANDIDASLVLIASQQRKGLSGVLRGNTIERIVEKMDRSILMI